MKRLHADHALLPGGFAAGVLLEWDAGGTLRSVVTDVPCPTDVERATGLLVPGLPNLHSHAFQRAFAGLTEYRGAAQDSFWTWRDLMYRFAAQLDPDTLEDIATHLYVEMLQAGYTAVCEFHYVHHDAQGRPHANAAEMSLRLAAAARRAGIGLTMLPVLYQHSGFGAKPPRADQRRFINSVEGLLRIVEALRAQGVRSGVAPHSLRAVAPPALADLLTGLDSIDPTAPIHIHVAEQVQEVDNCLAWSGQRPVQWLLDHAPVDRRWCLVHATHLDDAERAGAAASGAVIGLCPSTEANLGDGVFDAVAWRGAWGIGSDSHASVDAAEELRLLEYTQRLAQRQRNVLADARHPGVAEAMWLAAVAGGAQASGRALAGLAVGQQADFVLLADETLDGLTPSQQLATHVFASHRRATLREVWVAGIRRVQNGRHADAEAAATRFVAARRRLMAGLQ
ncbi:MAG: formimidoylglutamate deiminase [Piscinibacter sp.]